MCELSKAYYDCTEYALEKKRQDDRVILSDPTFFMLSVRICTAPSLLVLVIPWLNLAFFPFFFFAFNPRNRKVVYLMLK